MSAVVIIAVSGEELRAAARLHCRHRFGGRLSHLSSCWSMGWDGMWCDLLGVTWQIIGEIGVAGGTYRAMEFTGTAVEAMTVSASHHKTRHKLQQAIIKRHCECRTCWCCSWEAPNLASAWFRPSWHQEYRGRLCCKQRSCCLTSVPTCVAMSVLLNQW